MRRILLSVIGAVVLAAGIALWWWTRERGPKPLDPGWRASVLTFAGDGTPRIRDGWRGDASFSDPFGIAVSPDGVLYVADAGSSRAVRRITPDGRVTSIAPGTFETPSGIAVDASGALYVADTGSSSIVRLSIDGTRSVLAGPTDGLNGPVGLAVAADGRVIVAEGS